MGRFHRHDDGTVHTHEHDHHTHDHEHGDHSRYQTGKQRIDVLEAIFAENDVLAEANRAWDEKREARFYPPPARAPVPEVAVRETEGQGNRRG